MSEWTQHNDRDRILAATDLVQLMQEQISLKPQGREHVGLCPFHDDTRPSLHVVTHKGNAFYKCFACGAAGNAIDFVMKYHGKEFREALEFLADRANISLTPYKGRSSLQNSDSRTSKARLRQANQVAMDYFCSILSHPEMGVVSRKLLKERGFTSETIDKFSLGTTLDAWDGFLQHSRKRNLSDETCLAAGLLKRREDTSRLYDTFRNRLIFPIFDEMGHPIAFGGRAISTDDEPKYLNSPESALFDKSATLYGMHSAKRSIMDCKTAIITEGYTDVITCHQAGISNVVATLGTALTEQHARHLGRICDTVVLVFDGDEAGQRAADRALAIFFHAPLDIKICTLPDQLDPDDLIQQPHGKERFLEAVSTAQDALLFKMERFLNQLSQRESVAGQQKLLDDFLRELAVLGFNELQGVRKRAVLSSLSARLSVPLGELESALRRYKQLSRPRSASASAPAGSTEAASGSMVESQSTSDMWDTPLQLSRGRRLAEYDILAILLYDPNVLTGESTSQPLDSDSDRSPLTLDDFQDSTARRLAQIVLKRAENNESLRMQDLLDACGDDYQRRTLSHLYFKGEKLCGEDTNDIHVVWQQAVAALRLCQGRDHYQRTVTAGMRDANEPDRGLEALQEVLDQRRQQGDLAGAIAQNV